jgi:DNA (cytosine-5)-methyltransferase 1
LWSFGIEWDAAACATRAAAGHHTVRADLSTYRPHHSPGSVVGYWASPPCQSFSTAGKGEGRGQLDALAEVIHAQRWADADLFDDRTRHVIDAARTAVELHPEWIAMEQVPAVLPLWRALAHVLEGHGYSTWAGVLCAADCGVPQTRRRAILMASRTRCVWPPEPTHAEVPGMFGELGWVSMAEALGWPEDWTTGHHTARGAGMVERYGNRPPPPVGAPSHVVTGKARSWLVQIRDGGGFHPSGLTERIADEYGSPGGRVDTFGNVVGVESQGEVDGHGVDLRCRPTDVNGWPWERPATTVCADPRLGEPGHRDREGGEPQFRPDAIRLTVRDALILQGFDPEYPVQGSPSKQFEQVGNAVPPPLAAAIVGALTGVKL